jgi:outer membrane protein
MKFALPFFFLLIVWGTSSAQEAKVISLRAAIDSTLKNNLQIKQADFQAAISSEDLRQSRMNIYPSLGAGTNGRFNAGNFFDERTGTLENRHTWSADASLDASVVLFQGFQRLNEIKANRFLLESDKSNAQRVRNDLKLSVFSTYIEALTNRDLWEASKLQQELSKQQLEIEEASVDVGNKTLADLSQARSQLATDELNVTAARNAYEASLLDLKQLMEFDPQQEIVLEEPVMTDQVPSPNAQELYQTALAIFPEIKQAEFNTLAAEKQIDIAKGALYPTLSLSAGLGAGYTTSYRDSLDRVFPFRDQIRNDFSQYAGLSLRIPLFNNFQSRINVKKAKIRYASAAVDEQRVKNDLNKIVNQAVLDLRAAHQRYRSAELAFASMDETFHVFRERYAVGLSNAIELSTAQTNRNKAEFDFITSRYNLIFRSKVIDYYLGRPITFNNE